MAAGSKDRALVSVPGRVGCIWLGSGPWDLRSLLFDWSWFNAVRQASGRIFSKAHTACYAKVFQNLFAPLYS